MILQQFLPAICQMSSEFFVVRQDSAPAHSALEAIIHNFGKCWAI